MTTSVLAGGVRWHLVPGLPQQALLGADGLRLAEWLASGAATAVKARPARNVWRVRLTGLDFHLKEDAAVAGSRLRGLVRRSAVRAEFDRGRALAARGVATPEPLAFGESLRRRGVGYLLTRTLADGLPLDAFLQTTLPRLPSQRQTRLRQRVAAETGRFLALLHDAGVKHEDLHPGNLLVRIDPGDEPRLWLIDLHAARVGAPLGAAASSRNLVILNRWFVLRSSRSDRLRAWRAYRDARRWPPAPTAASDAGRLSPRRIERATLESNFRFWSNRDRRCLGSNRYFCRVRSPAVAGHAVADLPPDVLAPFLADPDAPLRDPGAIPLKASASSTVARLVLKSPDAVPGVVYKRFAVTSLSDPWAALARATAALRSWVMGHALLTRCLPTPRPLAVFQRCRGGLTREGYLLTEEIPRSVDLAAYVDRLSQLAGARSRPLLRDLLHRVGRLVRTLHDRHLSHRDLKAPNLLLRLGQDGLAVEDVLFIDLVGVRRHRKLRRGRRVQNLARLNASFHGHPGVTRADRLRLLRAYLAWGLCGRMGWKRWWHQVAADTKAKVRRNQRSGRPLH
jgi:tRNA A-37 threonylcarbamoyl transferase component Bud32